MKKYAFVFFAIASSILLRAQNDTVMVDILPWFEPMHSDRPGATFDATHIKQGVLIQGGFSGQFLEDGNNKGVASTVRFGTCIGEFNVTLGGSASLQEYLVENEVTFGAGFTDNRQTILGARYRYGWELTDDFTAGVILGISGGLDRLEQYYVSRDFIPDTTVFDTLTSKTNSFVYGGRIGINLAYQINDHWSLSSSIGIVNRDIEFRPTRATTTLNLGYSTGRLGLFVEGFITDWEDVSTRFVTGASYLIHRDLQIDAFISGPTEGFSSEQIVSNIGFTFWLR
ncbi:MAG: hypothetical protein HWE14_13955 [Flavobacteriia bacterium]|nr:hypothetical protein [Flavobacteriia bacterium]